MQKDVPDSYTGHPWSLVGCVRCIWTALTMLAVWHAKNLRVLIKSTMHTETPEDVIKLDAAGLDSYISFSHSPVLCGCSLF